MKTIKAYLFGVIMSLVCLSVSARYWKLYPKDELVKGKCLLECPRIYEPVCGSDGKTYSNDCMFERAKCLKPNPDLTIKGMGSCVQTKKNRFPTKLNHKQQGSVAQLSNLQTIRVPN